MDNLRQSYFDYLATTSASLTKPELPPDLNGGDQTGLRDRLHGEGLKAQMLWDNASQIIPLADEAAYLVVDDNHQHCLNGTSRHTQDDVTLTRLIHVSNSGPLVIDYRLHLAGLPESDSDANLREMLKAARSTREIKATTVVLLRQTYASNQNLQALHNMELTFLCPIPPKYAVRRPDDMAFVPLDQLAEQGVIDGETGLLTQLKGLSFDVRILRLCLPDGTTQWLATNQIDATPIAPHEALFHSVLQHVEQLQQEIRTHELTVQEEPEPEPPEPKLEEQRQEPGLRMVLPLAAAYFLFIAVTELVFAAQLSQVGIPLYALLLLLLYYQVARGFGQPLDRLALGLTFIPLVKFVKIPLATDLIAMPWAAVITGLPFLVGGLMVLPALGLDWRQSGLTLRRFVWQVPIAVLGLPLGFALYELIQPAPLDIGLNDGLTFVGAAAVIVVFTGLSDELVFRGLLQPTAMAALGKVAGILYVSLIYSLLMLPFLSPLLVVFALGINVLFGWLAWRSQSIVGIAIAHGLMNVMFLFALPAQFNW